ncbi:MAG: caspase family protein [Sphaerochaeta sp.]
MKWYGLLFIPMILLASCELAPFESARNVRHIGIGISYRGTDLLALEGPVNDAIALKKSFHSFFSSEPFDSTLLLQLGDEDGAYTLDEESLPTKEIVIETIIRTLGVMKKNDLLIITYSGHAVEDGSLVLAPDNSNGLLLEDNLDGALLGVDELISLFDRSEATILLILDSCYAGSFIPESGDVSTIDSKNRFENLWDGYRQGIDRNPRLFVLAATTADNTSKEPRFGSPIHGYFTKALLEALDTTSKQVTLDQIYHYIHEHQGFPTEGSNKLLYQHPIVSGGALDLVLRYSISPRSIR